METGTIPFASGIKLVHRSGSELNALLRRQTALRLRLVCKDQTQHSRK